MLNHSWSNPMQKNKFRKSLNRTISSITVFGIFCIMIGCILQLQGCAMAAVSCATTGVAMANDRRTTGTLIDDQATELKAMHAFSKNKPLWKQSHITTVCYNNVLLLVGQVESEELKQQAEEIASDFPKIRRIHNEITVGELAGLSTRSKDSWITTQIKAKLLTSKTVNPTRVKVVTENGVVYLMGLTTEAEELAATEIARAVDGVEKVVQIFEQIT